MPLLAVSLMLAAIVLAWWGWRMIVGTAVFLGFWLAAVAAERWIQQTARKHHVGEKIMKLLARTVKVVLFVAGAICALGTAGVDVNALVAGLGLTGFALGFALKDIIANLVAGVLLAVFRPFQPGDRIKVGAFEGTVASVDLRYTILEAEGQRYFVPNSMLFTNAITVFDPPPDKEKQNGNTSAD